MDEGTPEEAAAPVRPAAGRSSGDLVIRWIRLCAFAVALLLVVAVGAVVLADAGPPSVAQLQRQAGLVDKQVLRIGISGDIPRISERQGGDSYTGFDVDVAYLVARQLGFVPGQVEFYRVTPENRPKMIGRRDGDTTYTQLDLVIAGYSITDERIADGVVFAGPYLRTEPTVLTRMDHDPVESLSDLGRDPREHVCVPGTSTSAALLAEESGALAEERQYNSECVDGLLAGDFDAVFTDAAILAGFAAEHPGKLKLNNFPDDQPEWWGVGIGQDRTGHDTRIQAMRKLVLLALHDALAGREWRDAFERNLGDLPDKLWVDPGREPQIVAHATQPEPWWTVEVRRWPWENGAAGQVR